MKRTMKKALFAIFLMLTALQCGAVKISWGPYLQQVGTDRAVVVWGTDKDAVSWVETAPDDSMHFYACDRPRYYDTKLGRKNIGRIHRVKINGLTPGTTYRYRIFSQEVTENNTSQVCYGPVASTDVFRADPLQFTTLDNSKQSVRFKVINDIHGDTTRLARLVKGAGEDAAPDFVIYNGDMVSNMDNEKQVMDGFVNKSVELFASERPFYLVRGNHEGRGVFAEKYMDYFPTETGEPYYAFRQGPIFFVVLDGGEDKPDSDIEYFGLNRMDDYREAQAEWLKGIVSSQEFIDTPYKVAIVHVPPIGGTWHGTLHANKVFMPVLNDADIDIMLCGHLHSHVFIPAENGNNHFPVLINSNVDAVDVEATPSSMELWVRDIQGHTIRRLSIKP